MPNTLVLTGNVNAKPPSGRLAEELFEPLLTTPGARIERIVSTGQVTPPGEWFDQDTEEWVLLVAGAACLRIHGEDKDRALAPGDWIHLPAHCRHRVTWTQAEPPTIWLAVHFGS